ncbi:MAG: hypothetical protein A2W01_00415 [Candidatus Solincola sediminis]|uniref:B box-type domain-containing protein n=1 Tax=Candidatus Solincola sediminis TaxID=1797199 RepID=A0A1F2WHS0_9ACTN|nr:MAG: hypothetical protein A2Y75_04070 [Candidatus Solincola sediminis]OFW61729.1 MAG: hypothetical protein A2W01_00415 [Candidatus Solincola sediminis]
MNCPRHPGKRTVTACKDCGAEFCIDCVRETDQTTLCPECYRRKLSDITKEYEPSSLQQKPEPQAAKSEKLRGRAARKQELAARRERLIQGHIPESVLQTPPEPRATATEPEAPEAEAGQSDEGFLAGGPDQDFSFLEPEKKDKSPKGRWVAKVREKKESPAPAVKELEEPVEDIQAPSNDDLISDVVSTLLMPGVQEDLMEEILPIEIPIEEIPEERPRQKPREKPKREPREKPARVKTPKRTAEEISAAREERAERWSFLAQPRVSEDTSIAGSKPRAAAFIVLMLLLGAVLWAVPNAYLIPKDQEYGIHALIIGIVMGLLFWWKAGKKHGNRLAIQAGLVTFGSIFLGEFLHWFLIIVKNQAFRTIFFDLISFKFIWENGAQIMRNIMEAMFPTAFILILLLPSAAAFFITFGMPPIPEIFLQMGRAFKGGASEEGEAEHGVEN